MEDRRNRNYDDFFRTDDHNPNKDQQSGNTTSEQDIEHTKESWYYSYGPYRSQVSHTVNEQQQRVPEASPDVTVPAEPVEAAYVAPPQEGAQERYYAPAPANSAAGEPVWQIQQPRRKMWLVSFLAAFLSCALIMTGLVYAADVNNWFTGGPVSAAQSDSSGDGDGAVVQGTPVVTANHSETRDASAAAGLPGSIADIVEQSSPAVVLIETYVSSSRRSGRYNMDFFEFFFGDRIQTQPDRNREMINSGLGTGFIFDKDGYILTNEHVVSNADEIYVTVEGYTEPFKAELLGSDFDLDLAVLKINGSKEFATLPIGDSTKLRVGEWVTAIGNPLGYDHTVSVGVLSAKGRRIQIPEGNRTRYYEDLLQTDASINSGNSGGPLLNMSGEVIGINTAVSTSAQGIGFAIPSSTIVTVIDLLKNNEKVPKPYIGVGINNIAEAWLEDLKLDSTEGALVTQVESGSPAAIAGIQTWDVIIKINDKKVSNYEDVKKYIQELGVGARATVTIKRDGKELQVGIIIGDRNAG